MLSETLTFLVCSFLIASLSAWALESAYANPLALKYCDLVINGVNVTRPVWGSRAPTRPQCLEFLQETRKRDGTNADFKCKCYLGADA